MKMSGYLSESRRRQIEELAREKGSADIAVAEAYLYDDRVPGIEVMKERSEARDLAKSVIHGRWL
jgi:hypothetical protein